METNTYKWSQLGGPFHITLLLTTHHNLTTMSTTFSGSKSKQVSMTTRHTPHRSQKQRNYAMTCGRGSLSIITGDGKRKCIGINVDVRRECGGKLAELEIRTSGNINVTATVRTLSVDGGPAEDEETEVKVEVATNQTPETHAAENTTHRLRQIPRVRLSHLILYPSILIRRSLRTSASTQAKRRIEPTSPPSITDASQPSTSKMSSSSTVAAAPQTRSMRRKRGASEMESSNAVQGSSVSVNGGRQEAGESPPRRSRPRSPPRRGRLSDFQI
ncbi:hypothetical protein B0H14DRAFT_2976580 [Mycena olivaceomarginata]|nr:hypothetical protein B0H14DRAFT_2976580 [Mycena olivaceomarginata]